MLTRLFRLMFREWRIAFRLGGGGSMALLFFLILTLLLPFGLGTDPLLLSKTAPAFLWIAALLASLLAMDRLFAGDAEDGTLDLWRMMDIPLELVFLAKCVAHWILHIVPLIICAPLMGILFGLEFPALWRLFLSLLVGTPGLIFWGALGAALTIHLKRGGFLGAILILPFTIPTLIFGVSSISTSSLVYLAALSLMGFAIMPFVLALTLRR